MLSYLVYLAPPVLFGWLGTGVLIPIAWWVFLAVLAFLSEHRPAPGHNEWKSRPIAFVIALPAFVAIYYLARWLAPV